MLPIIGDHKKAELSKTEKAMEMLQEQLNGIQRQIAGVCLKQGITFKQFAEYNHKGQEIMEFLVNAQKEEDLIIQEQNKQPLKEFEIKNDQTKA